MEKNASVNRSFGDIHAEGNPHYLLNPSNAIKVIEYLNQSLSDLFPKQASQFKKNTEALVIRLQLKIEEWNKKMRPFKNRSVVIYHKNWVYFCDFFHLNIANTIEPKPGVPPTIRHINNLITQMKDQKIDTIIQAPYFEKRTLKHLAKKTGAKVYILAHQVGALRENKYLY